MFFIFLHKCINHSHKESIIRERQESMEEESNRTLAWKPTEVIRKELVHFSEESVLITAVTSCIRRNPKYKKLSVYPKLPTSREVHNAVQSLNITIDVMNQSCTKMKSITV